MKERKQCGNTKLWKRCQSNFWSLKHFTFDSEPFNRININHYDYYLTFLLYYLGLLDYAILLYMKVETFFVPMPFNKVCLTTFCSAGQKYTRWVAWILFCYQKWTSLQFSVWVYVLLFSAHHHLFRPSFANYIRQKWFCPLKLFCTTMTWSNCIRKHVFYWANKRMVRWCLEFLPTEKYNPPCNGKMP